MDIKWQNFAGAYLLLGLLLTLNCGVSAATEAVSNFIYNPSSDFSVSRQSDASSDFLIVEHNSATTQLNFERFFVSDKPVVIKLANDSKIETLVISSPILDIRNKVSVIGKPVNVVFTSPTGTLQCLHCSFENVERVTFLNGIFSGDSMTTYATGRVTINGLSAPGVHSLEVMADQIITSGTIDLNLRAQRHPQGGFIFAENGDYVLGSGGVNLYPGRVKIKYSNLDVISASTKNDIYRPGGTFKAASIGIVAAQPVVIPPGTEINTLSDALTTSTRQGHFHAPAEGVFIQIARHESAALNVYGKLYSDRIITTKTIGNTTLHSSARVFGQTVKNFTDGYLFNQGYVDADHIKVAAERVINSGTLNGAQVTLEADGDAYNTFGGVIKAGYLSIVLNDGIFTNGARTNKLRRPARLPLLAPSVDVNSLKHGPYSRYSTAGTKQSRLSAKIHANTVTIVANAIENINPYHIEEPTGVDWSDGISVNTTQSEQVSIAAESKMELKASKYIRNTSAILRLNQQGRFHVDTPLLFNERYRLETTSFIISRYAYTSDKKGSRDQVEKGVGTKVSAYSPPGRIVSFGEFELGSKQVPSTRRRMVNAFSYFEVFQNARFQKLDLESVGIVLSSTITQQSSQAAKQCIVLGSCAGSAIDTSVEGETLFAIHGNVYGINPEVETTSDFKKSDIGSLTPEQSDLVHDYFSSRYSKEFGEDHYHRYNYGAVYNEPWVSAYYAKCNGFRYEEHGQTRLRNCTSAFVKILLSDILAETSTAEFAGTGFTYKQVRDTAEAYARRNQTVSTAEDYRCKYTGDVIEYQCTAKNFNFIDVLVNEAEQAATVNFSYQIKIEHYCDQCQNKYSTRDVEKSLRISVAELMKGQ
ncbi:hypothetical protein C3B51_20200 [Pseudoalteromonas rubra]|uniref:Filamentous haemagglutinin FhaB/tRNA nuclease CdiA-like TPS domain-containing protein n=1 Tax=Pseudoalteromonas rubra TaxID=43658 RepID=A0A4Q7E0C8_9GAMM|nr:hypothetical protein [Pseudoalteromonas rubra]RZM74015.1 hypothetical protein C3B51_20200 [Pseudoalteromonas rubra]